MDFQSILGTKKTYYFFENPAVYTLPGLAPQIPKKQENCCISANESEHTGVAPLSLAGLQLYVTPKVTNTMPWYLPSDLPEIPIEGVQFYLNICLEPVSLSVDQDFFPEGAQDPTTACSPRTALAPVWLWDKELTIDMDRYHDF